MCDCLERYRFMRRLYHALNDFEVYYITGEPLIKVLCYIYSENCVFIKHPTNSSSPPPLTNEISDSASKSIEVLNNEISLDKAESDIAIIIEALNKHFLYNPPYKVVVWNGQQVLGRALSLYCKNNNIKTRYLEIANFHNKIFCDDKGVNALSQLAKTPSLLDKYSPVDEFLHRDWLVQYVNSKGKPLPQSIRSKKNLFASLINNFLKLLIPCIGPSNAIFKKLKNPTSKLNFTNIHWNNTPLIERYLFLPLQVSNDTQIKLHSKVDNIGAIKKAYKLSQENNINLVVKFHPAELSQREVDSVAELQNKLGFIIDNSNTIDLIKSAETVVTINSTVGLEAKILGKNVCVYGNAHYKEFDDARIKKYIHCFLIDGVDYFGKNAISSKTAREIINN